MDLIQVSRSEFHITAKYVYLYNLYNENSEISKTPDSFSKFDFKHGKNCLIQNDEQNAKKFQIWNGLNTISIDSMKKTEAFGAKIIKK